MWICDENVWICLPVLSFKNLLQIITIHSDKILCFKKPRRGTNWRQYGTHNQVKFICTEFLFKLTFINVTWPVKYFLFGFNDFLMSVWSHVPLKLWCTLLGDVLCCTLVFNLFSIFLEYYESVGTIICLRLPGYK